MAHAENAQALCSSVFKSGENRTTREAFTSKWIEMVNQLEKNKGIAATKR